MIVSNTQRKREELNTTERDLHVSMGDESLKGNGIGAIIELDTENEQVSSQVIFNCTIEECIHIIAQLKSQLMEMIDRDGDSLEDAMHKQTMVLQRIESLFNNHMDNYLYENYNEDEIERAYEFVNEGMTEEVNNMRGLN